MRAAQNLGPGDGRKLYRELQRSPLMKRQSGRPTIGILGTESLLKCVNSLRMSSPFIWGPPDNPFSFLSSSSLRGAANPTADLPCRLDQAQRLARFAALYADTVLIEDPFDYFESDAETDFGKADLGKWVSGT